MMNETLLRRRRPWLAFAVFALAGPLVGAAALIGGLVADRAFAARPLELAFLAQAGSLAVITLFAYLGGLLPAAACGAWIIAASARRQSAVRPAAAGAIGALCAGMMGALTGSVPTAAIFAAVGMFAAAVLTQLVRRWL